MTRRALALYAAGTFASGSAIVAAQGALWWYAAILVAISAVLYGRGERARDRADARAHERAVRPHSAHVGTAGQDAAVILTTAIQEQR